MDNKIILTIGRQFGSGGREVGQKLAKELGIGYYDKELINLASEESGREGFQWFGVCFYDGLFVYGVVPAVCRCAV